MRAMRRRVCIVCMGLRLHPHSCSRHLHGDAGIAEHRDRLRLLHNGSRHGRARAVRAVRLPARPVVTEHAPEHRSRVVTEVTAQRLGLQHTRGGERAT